MCLRDEKQTGKRMRPICVYIDSTHLTSLFINKLNLGICNCSGQKLSKTVRSREHMSKNFQNVFSRTFVFLFGEAK